MNKPIAVCVALVFAASTMACGKSYIKAKVDEPKTEQKDGAQKDDGAANKEAKAEPKAQDPQKEKQAPAGKTGMTATKFADTAPTVLCEWLTSCKNEEVAFGVQIAMELVIEFGAMTKPDMKHEIHNTVESMKDTKHLKLDMDRCKVLSSLGAKLVGIDRKTLVESIKAKRVTFDAAKAAICLKGFKNVKACETEKKVGAKPKISEVEKMIEPYEEDLEKLGASCGEALIGQVDKDAACVNGYECKGELRCKGTKPGEQERKCVDW